MKKEGQLIIKSKFQADTLLATIFKKNKILSRIDLSRHAEILQTSIVAIGKDSPILAHKHNLIKRETYGTQEVWIIVKGKALVGFYDLDNSYLCSKRVVKGDMVLSFGGGHSIKSISRTLTFIEIKNGPYLGAQIDKVSIDN